MDGLVERLTVNGVDVAAFVEQELDRRDPERALLRAEDQRGLLDAWAALEQEEWLHHGYAARDLAVIGPT
ncbi:MAG TPA: hypothetical protein VJ804_04110 [Acidimicrobiales bacterium]|nr:hypothetical protein [Acidimicrobiales bacterium]